MDCKFLNNHPSTSSLNTHSKQSSSRKSSPNLLDGGPGGNGPNNSRPPSWKLMENPPESDPKQKIFRVYGICKEFPEVTIIFILWAICLWF
jgi:hypothetical protein